MSAYFWTLFSRVSWFVRVSSSILWCIISPLPTPYFRLDFFLPLCPAPRLSPRRLFLTSYTSLNQGGELSVSWLYVGANQLFDIYIRQDGKRVSDNLCAGEADGSCKATGPVASATVTMPVELENSGDYRLLVSPPPPPNPRS